MIQAIGILFYLFTGLSYGQVDDLSFEINRAIDRSGLTRSQLGIHISEDYGDSPAEVFQLNSDRGFIPASVTKLFTAAAVLDKIPLDHNFMTEFRSTGSFDGSTLNGDLYYVGSGDPGFVTENLWALVSALHRKGIQWIDGDLVVDSSVFDDVLIDPGREPDDTDSAYAAPLTGSMINWNSVAVYINPGQFVGDSVQVYIDSATNYFSVVNNATTSFGNSNTLSVRRARNMRGIDTVYIDGSLGLSAPEVVSYKSVTDPELWTANQVLSILNLRGIFVSGQIRFARAPERARALASFPGQSLFDSIKDLMKFSNNLMAEGLTKQLAAIDGEKPATMAKGLRLIQSFLRKARIPRENLVIKNSAGLSRQNQLAPRAVHSLLLYLKNRSDIFPELLASLPIAGVDGTLRRRMINSPARGFVRAKTGTLQGVTGLAGYVRSESGRSYNFSYFFNGNPIDRDRSRDLWDDLGEILYLDKGLIVEQLEEF